jgi:hypothetical protein
MHWFAVPEANALGEIATTEDKSNAAVISFEKNLREKCGI